MFVYIIQSGSEGPYKIGAAINVDKRISDLQVGNPEELTLIAKFDFKDTAKAYHAEYSLHRLYRKSRIRGEWFNNNIKLKWADEYFKTDFADQKTVLRKQELEERIIQRIDREVLRDSPL